MTIVLGEAVAQVVNVAADADWSRTLWWDVLAGFGLLVCLWWLTLEVRLDRLHPVR